MSMLMPLESAFMTLAEEPESHGGLRKEPPSALRYLRGLSPKGVR
jgi:hypothetical protein